MVRVFIICKNHERVRAQLETVLNYKKLKQLLKSKRPNSLHDVAEEPIEMFDVPADVMSVALFVVARGEEETQCLQLPPYVEAAFGGVIIKNRRKAYQIHQLIMDLGLIGTPYIEMLKGQHIIITTLKEEFGLLDEKKQRRTDNRGRSVISIGSVNGVQ